LRVLLTKFTFGLADNIRWMPIMARKLFESEACSKGCNPDNSDCFAKRSDPIGAGLVSSINRPTGNVTGIAPMFTLLEFERVSTRFLATRLFQMPADVVVLTSPER
jgi:hypothetical protein